MIGSIAAIVIYIGMLYFKIWEMVPPEHRWWVGAALILMFLWGPTQQIYVIKKVVTKR